MLTFALRPVALSGSLAVLLMLTGCQAPPAADAGGTPPDVGVASVITREVRIADDFNGRVEAIQSVDIRPRVSGYIDRIAFTEGAEVKAGELLFVIDPRPYRDALKSAQARLESARAAAKLAQSRFTRADKLVVARAISREDFDASQANLDQTAADVRGAEATVATARLNLGFTDVRSPVAGRAGRALLTVGNLARVDDTLLTTVVSQETIYVYFDCDEQSYLRYGAGGNKASPTVRIGLGNEDGFPHPGKVDFLDNRLDPATGTIRARAVVSNADRKLTPGMFARVQFENGAPVKALLIEDKAVLTDQDRRYVYVVDAGKKALRKDVVLGRKVDDMRIVQSGLAADDRVIVSGAQKVYASGEPVNPVTDPAPHTTAKAAPSTD